MGKQVDSNPSVYNEPFFNPDHKGGTGLSAEVPDHLLAEEPALASTGAIPRDSLTYGQWYLIQKEYTTVWAHLGWWLSICLLSGPLAVISTFLSSHRTSSVGILGVIFVAPVLEEFLKIALPLIIVETRPYLFSSPIQIVVACMLSALVFAGIENLLYLHHYIPNPSAFIAAWRWQVCTAMHVGATTVASLGLVRVWRYSDEFLIKPSVQMGFPLYVSAMLIHGLYNTTAITLEAFGFFNL